MTDPLLLPRHALRLEIAQAVEPEALERFVDCFRAAWGRIPLTPKRVILSAWRNYVRLRVARLIGRKLYDGVVVAVDLPGTALALCDSGRVFYDAQKLDQHGDGLIETVCAHELAHAFLIGSWDQHGAAEYNVDPNGKVQGEYWHDACEQAVRRMTLEWGFTTLLTPPTIKPRPVAEAQAHQFIV